MNAQLASYRTTATATRQRRQAAGKYAKPTAAQDAAFRRYISPREELQAGDAALLATHPWLTVSQRAEFATKLYWEGFDAYRKGAQLEDMQTHEQRNGWWFANKCEGDTNDYAGDIADREYHARGGW